MMREPVEHGGGHLLVAEDLGPFPKARLVVVITEVCS